MADFASLATSYVLADDEDEQRKLAGKAAEAIQNAPRKRTAVLNWAQSINQWMPHNNGDGDGDDDNVIVRAKALGFLAATLEVLDKNVLRAEQLDHLLVFFGAMFAIDHKAGILAAATALRCLCAMHHFRAPMAAAVLGHLAKLGDDFRLQAPPTRRAIYDLVLFLLRRDDAGVLAHLQASAGPSAPFLRDLLQLCRHERDPDNLLLWFSILQQVLAHYQPLDPEVAEAVFHAASDYFPISMRSAATPAGTTVDDLKTALRGCFAASALAAPSVFDFLLQKMDQGDALTVAVKVDILRTIHACVETFPVPVESVVPHTSRIWNSLKYEVRHGDVVDTINWTLRVIEAISARLDQIPEPAACLRDFVELVLADCIGDLGNSTFTKPAGQLLTSTLRGGMRAFNLVLPSVLAAVKETLSKTQTANHTRDLVAFLNSVLQTRHDLVEQKAKEAAKKDSEATPDTETAGPSAVTTEFYSHDGTVLGLLDGVYLQLWNRSSQDSVVLVEVIRGLAALVVQRTEKQEPPPPRGTQPRLPLLCSPVQCTIIFSTLAPRILNALPAEDETTLSPADSQMLAHEAMVALQVATVAYPEGFSSLVAKLVALIDAEQAKLSASKTTAAAKNITDNDDVNVLRDALSRVAYIGCATISDPPEDGSLAVGFFRHLTGTLVASLESLLGAKAPFCVSLAVLSGIYAAALHLRAAFSQRGFVPSVADQAAGKHATAGDGNGRDSGSEQDKDRLAGPFHLYVDEALSIVRRLYLRATTTAEDDDHDDQLDLSADFDLPSSSLVSEYDDQDAYLHQLSSLAAFVVRDLTADQQVGAQLHTALFRFFHPSHALGRASFFHNRHGGRADVLSLGILNGLRPSVLANVTEISASSANLLSDFGVLDRLPPRTRLVRNNIATVAANKYSASTSTNTANAVAWKATVADVRDRLTKEPPSGGSSSPPPPPPLTPDQFARLVAVASGAFARLDPAARPLAPLLALAPAAQVQARDDKSFKRALQMARLLGGLVVAPTTTTTVTAATSAAADRGVLTPENHAVVKALHRQWVYGQTVQTLLPLAFPRRPATEGKHDDAAAAAADAARRVSTVHTVAILALVRRMPVAVYEDDVDNGTLVRIVVAAATTLAPQWADVAAALRVLTTLLAARRADAVQGHLKAVVDAAVCAFAPPAPPGTSTDTDASLAAVPPPPACRKQALVLVGELPEHFDKTLLLPYEPRLARALAASCGDRVRELRTVAQQARERWNKVAL